MEIKPIPGYEKEYAIGENAVVYRLLNRKNNLNRPYETPKAVSSRKGAGGYWVVSLCKDNKTSTRRISRLMLMAFVGMPPNEFYQAAHLDGNIDNNNISNLKWVLQEENENHKKAHDTVAKGERNGFSKLTSAQVCEIRKRASSGESRAMLAKEFNVSKSNISSIVNGNTWKDSELFYKDLYFQAIARERQLREALQELVELMEDTRCGDYKPDSFTCQPAFEALAIPQDTTALDALIRDAKNEQQESDYRQFNALCGKYVSKAGEVMRERCARRCEVEAHERFNEYGTREHDTGATYYQGGASEEYEARDEEDEACAQAIRALPGVTLEDLK